MRWPPWPFSTPSPDSQNSSSSSSLTNDSTTSSSTSSRNPSSNLSASFPKTSWPSPAPPADLAYWLSPQTLLPALVITSSILAGRKLYTVYFRRYSGATSLPPTTYHPAHPRPLFGIVTSVGDGDGFRLFHTPGGVLAGWGWFPGRRIPKDKKKLRELGTISVRLAGVDAPETAHFGKPGQRGGEEAREWLGALLERRRVWCRVYKKDQYDRLVASVRIARWGGLGGRRDVGLMMLNKGIATVYEAKSGGVFGGREMEERYRRAEAWARWWKRGVWRKEGESPREFKERTADMGEKGAKG